MPFGTSLIHRESLLRVSGEERNPYILISFHSSGSTSNQWRKLENQWFPGSGDELEVFFSGSYGCIKS